MEDDILSSNSNSHQVCCKEGSFEVLQATMKSIEKQIERLTESVEKAVAIHAEVREIKIRMLSLEEARDEISQQIERVSEHSRENEKELFKKVDEIRKESASDMKKVVFGVLIIVVAAIVINGVASGVGTHHDVHHDPHKGEVSYGKKPDPPPGKEYPAVAKTETGK